jgi:hypothetical protein
MLVGAAARFFLPLRRDARRSRWWVSERFWPKFFVVGPNGASLSLLRV